jgi:hypothetical protein
MSDPVRSESRQDERTDTERTADHAAIAGSIDELLPALIAKLGATGLAELEVRENGLRVRLRRPADGSVAHDRRATDRATDRAARGDRPRARPAASTHGPTDAGPGRDSRDGRWMAATDSNRRRGASGCQLAGGGHLPSATGSSRRKRVRRRSAGTVDMLGVPQEVVAPTDGWSARAWSAPATRSSTARPRRHRIRDERVGRIHRGRDAGHLRHPATPPIAMDH